MSFIQRFLERVLRNNPERMPRTSFDDLSQEQLDAHLRAGRYGNFQLTDAMRPSIGLVSRGGVYDGWPSVWGSVGPMCRTVEDAARLLDVLLARIGL